MFPCIVGITGDAQLTEYPRQSQHTQRALSTTLARERARDALASAQCRK